MGNISFAFSDDSLTITGTWMGEAAGCVGLVGDDLA